METQGVSRRRRQSNHLASGFVEEVVEQNCRTRDNDYSVLWNASNVRSVPAILGSGVAVRPGGGWTEPVQDMRVKKPHVCPVAPRLSVVP